MKKGYKCGYQRIRAKADYKEEKTKRYEQRIFQFRQNQLLQVNQEQVDKEQNGEKQGDRIISNSEDNTKFWIDIWSKEQNITNTLSG